MTAHYADTSALAKLLVLEQESAAMVAFLGADTDLVTSEITVTELHRLAARLGVSSREVDALLSGLSLVRVTGVLLRQAGFVRPPELRSLDAIHLATAAAVGLDGFLCYDTRLAAAAAASGLNVLAPT